MGDVDATIWERVDKPILKLLADADRRPLNGTELGEATGFEASVLMRSLRSLKEANLITGTLVMADQEEYPVMGDGIRLTPDGLREAGVWPSRDVAASLIAVLEELVANEPDEDKRGRLQRALDALKAMGPVALGAAIGQAIGAVAKHIPGM